MAVRPAVKTKLAGAVVAGGESRRMGEDKALIVVDGEALWRRQVRVLREAGAAPVWVVRRPGQTTLGAADVPELRDEFVDAGPLAGLHAALKAMPADAAWLAVLAVDLPAMEAAWLRELSAACVAGRGAVARHARGFEPLAAIYPREALAVVTAQLAAGRFSLQATVAALVADGRLTVRTLEATELAPLANWNTPADRAAAGGRSF